LKRGASSAVEEPGSTPGGAHNFGRRSSMAGKTMQSEKGEKRLRLSGGKFAYRRLGPSEYLPARRRIGQGNDSRPEIPGSVKPWGLVPSKGDTLRTPSGFCGSRVPTAFFVLAYGGRRGPLPGLRQPGGSRVSPKKGRVNAVGGRVIPGRADSADLSWKVN
jgi:hypothetical protein